MMKHFFATVAILTALLLGADRSWSAEPLLSIIFSANSEGAVRPCPVCGGRIIGGLSRRATYIQQSRQSAGKTVPVFAVSGGFEFLPESGKQPDQAKLQALAKAYGMINFDLGLLTPGEAGAMRKAGVNLPGQWITAEAVTQTQLPLPGGGAVGFVLFPPLTPTEKEAPKDLIAQISKAVETQRKKSNIVVGLSPWGYFVELLYLRSNDAVLPDVLLGSGPGPGFKGMVAGEGRAYWMRAYSLGKALNRLEVLAWPKREAGFRWSDDMDIRSLNVGLTDQFKEDPAIAVLFEGMETD
jgi:hypothetical protein